MNDHYFETILELSEKASKKDEVPVSALLVKDDRIIAKAYNKRVKNKSVLSHAEIIVILKANKKLKTWHLDDCDLYVTLKPCSMCEAVIKQSHIKNVYYLLEKESSKKEFCRTNVVKANNSMLEEKYANILKDFFQKKRDKNNEL